MPCSFETLKGLNRTRTVTLCLNVCARKFVRLRVTPALIGQKSLRYSVALEWVKLDQPCVFGGEPLVSPLFKFSLSTMLFST